MLEVERPTAGRMIDRLERKGWVIRRPDAADRRVKRLYLTTEAEGVQAEMGQIAAEMVDDAMASLAPKERLALGGMLERVKGTLLAMGPAA
jgi:MarR family transcriptional regulator for hemolysin